MCGIAGLHVRDSALQAQLGSLLQSMLCKAAERGTDAAGVGIYGDTSLTPAGTSTVCVIESPVSAAEGAARLDAAGVGPVTFRDAGQTSVFSAPAPTAQLEAAVRAALPGAVLTSRGSSLAVLKGTGHPDALASTFRLADATGYQGVAHTRMATESAVTSTGSHPYSVGPDQCMVHNGSFANHATIRRELQAEGIVFDSENDTEVGARFVAKHLAEGADVEKALRLLCERFDGFYTLLVATENSFAVVRDAIACKPAIIAETDAWVAMASEYRYLAGLPGVESARIFEPEPEVVYAWER
ncbi:N-methylglutamate synthase subunit A [Quadrisphaera granulorum]|uniref:glutamine--fructose-6-phosphate transaminase (isomerizing) n=1 Tax=Quadrisphaera granulorum TaxID=317664 RepID=A0A316AW26_9ACTN|nr:glutamine amidotransferase [Quadrisphaera granulorum]PWJ54337.1 N-methylglutamate synthase subunit A [Quadrisphaera granulorum]SZE96109.1 N-methylglutamate synthase subunit A [Quadrisphaera granulorum]